MSKEPATPPKMPYRLEESRTPGNNGAFNLYLLDANGRKIAALWGKGEEKLALGVFIVEASEKIAQQDGGGIIRNGGG